MPRSDDAPGGASSLAEWLAGQRWFATKTKRIVGVDVVDRVLLGDATLAIAAVALDDGSIDRYAMPLRAGAEIIDALEGGEYAAALFALMARGGRAPGERGALVGVPTRACSTTSGDLPARRLGSEQSNTSVTLGSDVILKNFRRLASGRNPEEEVTRFLTERTTFAHAPRLYGHAEYRTPDGTTCTLAVAHELIRGVADGWTWIAGELARILAEPVRESALLATAEISLRAIERLGEVTAALHRALASDAREPSFAPEPVTPADVARWSDAVRARLDDARAALAGGRLPEVPDVGGGLAALLGTQRIRHHGDYHLGQTLYRPASGDWFVIDFEGEPLRPLAERRDKHAALRDVAGMLRSIDYAAVAASRESRDERGKTSPRESTERRARIWEQAAAARFSDGYRSGMSGTDLVPATDAAFTRAVAAFVVEKAAYEIVYEANHRPGWIRIPLDGLARAGAAGAIGPPAGAA